MSLAAPYELTHFCSSARFGSFYLQIKQGFVIFDAQRGIKSSTDDYSITNIGYYHNKKSENF